MNIDELLSVMERLRDPEHGCPWDREQTFETVAPYTIEESYEVADAIAREDMRDLRDELGDLLFQVVFHAQLAKERRAFDFHSVVAGIVEKMTRRHPHVFGDAFVADAQEQTAAWEEHKARERAERSQQEDHSLLDGVARALPALKRAEKIQRRVARVGFDWPVIDGAIDKIGEELQEVRAEVDRGDRERLLSEIGDLLFSCVNLARHAEVDAEQALRAANARFEGRFRAIERALRTEGRSPEDATAAELDALWEAAKRAEAGN